MLRRLLRFARRTADLAGRIGVARTVVMAGG